MLLPPVCLSSSSPRLSWDQSPPLCTSGTTVHFPNTYSSIYLQVAVQQDHNDKYQLIWFISTTNSNFCEETVISHYICLNLYPLQMYAALFCNHIKKKMYVITLHFHSIWNVSVSCYSNVLLSSKKRDLWGICSLINKLTNEISGANMYVWCSNKLTPCNFLTCR